MISSVSRSTPTSFGLSVASLRPGFARRGIASMLVPDHIRKTVLFIGIKKDGEFRPRATAFAVSAIELDMRLGFIVTADHVVSQLLGNGHELWLRANLKDGTAVETPIPSDAWRFSPDETNRADVAVCQVNFGGEEDIYAISLNGEKAMAATDDVIREHHIGVGEEVAIIGLFRSHYGHERNVPIVRIGNISAMTEEPIKIKDYGYVDAYLIETHSIGGLSGSPVFVNMAPTRIIDGKTEFTRGSQFYLLGLMHGHFDIRNLNEDMVVDDISSAAGNINTGIGVVIPVSKINEIIFETSLITEWRRLIIEWRKTGEGTTPDL